MTQYSIRLKRSAIHALAVYFLYSMMPSVTCLWLGDASVICQITYCCFPIQPTFSTCIRRQTAPALRRTIGFNTQYRTLPKIWIGTFPVRSVQLRGNTKLILTVKMETRHPIEGQFGSEFLEICNHCELWRTEVARRGNFVSIFCVSVTKLRFRPSCRQSGIAYVGSITLLK